MTLDLLATHADIVFSTAGWILNVFATLMFLDNDTRVSTATGLVYAAVIGVTGLTYLSLGLHWSALSYGYGWAIWSAIAVQSQTQDT